MKKFVILFSLLFLFTLPCISSALTILEYKDDRIDSTFDKYGASIYSYVAEKRWHRYDYNDHGFGNYHEPHYISSATPVPSTFWLLGTAVVGALGVKRRLVK